MGSIPGSGRSPGEGNGNPLQYSCLKNPTGRGTWWAAVHGVAKSQTRLSNSACMHEPFTRTGKYTYSPLLGIFWASLVAQMVKNPPVMQDYRVQSLGWEEPLEKGMATPSSILPWRIPWTEEPGRL